MSSDVALNRDALYYPYIHITDVDWLKAALLSFPRVKRMVPPGYVPVDSPEINEFCNIIGPGNEPLLSTVDLFSDAAKRAEERLLAKLESNDDLIRSRYSHAATLRELGPKADQLRLHDEKIVLNLFNHLIGSEDMNSLAWRTTAPPGRPDRNQGQWLALHPALGSAILAVKAVAISRDLGLDIVTESSSVHQVVASHVEDEIFDQLIGKVISPTAPSIHDTVDDLTEIVMTTAFDVTRFTPQDIKRLQSDGKDLRRFKNAVLPIAASIPPIPNRHDRQRKLEAAAREILDEWRKYKDSLPKFAVDALTDAAKIEWRDLKAAGILGTSAMIGAGLDAGIGRFLVSYAGIRVISKYRDSLASPYLYLNKIEKVGKKRQSFLSVVPRMRASR